MRGLIGISGFGSENLLTFCVLDGMLKICSMICVNARDEASHNAAVQSAKAYLDMCQDDLLESEKALFPNHWRGTDDIVRRFRGDGTVKKLKELKAVWDPEGVFTKQFL